MKTPFPHKVDNQSLEGGWGFQERAMTLEELRKSHNQLITYLAELTEVVEGKPCKCNIAPDSVHYRDCPLATPTLKQQLLGEIQKEKQVVANIDSNYFEPALIRNKAISDIEAIINRLIL